MSQSNKNEKWKQRATEIATHTVDRKKKAGDLKWLKVELSSFCYEIFFYHFFSSSSFVCTPDIQCWNEFLLFFLIFAHKVDSTKSPKIKYHRCGWHFSWIKARSNLVTLHLRIEKDINFSCFLYFLLNLIFLFDS